MTAAMLGFAHTVGEFGVVLMIGGNIPGKTRVVSVADLRPRGGAGVRAGALARRRHAGVLVRWCCWCSTAEPAATPRMSRERDACIQAALHAGAPRLHARRGARAAGARRDRAVRPLGLRQDHAAALHRGPGARAGRPASRRRARSGRTMRSAASCPRTGARWATCSRRRACSRT